jgi:Z1 domain
VQKDELVTVLRQLVQGGSTVEAAVRNLRSLGGDEGPLQAAIVDYETQVKIIRSLKIPAGLVDKDIVDGWYAGPRNDDVFWPALRDAMLADGLPGGALDGVDRSSSKIVGYLSPPGSSVIRTRGLVVGHVQSGKTTNFMSVIAKSADVGYRLFIILSGIHNSLRWQTQNRLNRQLIGSVEKQWFRLTDESDFVSPGNANFLLADPGTRLVAVVKKNPSRLRRLTRWLDQAAPETLRNCPILVIDDEADQASIDVGTEEQRSAINRRILELLEGSGSSRGTRKAAYIGYTATPFANLLIDPSAPDLYPRDFVIDLEQPDGHFGTEVIFGREALTPDEEDSLTDGWDMVREIPDDEIEATRPPARRVDAETWTPRLCPSLRDAMDWFVLAAAARRVRGVGVPHSTMLIHTTMRVHAQEMLQLPVIAHLNEVRVALDLGDGETVDRLRGLWESETARLPSAELGQRSVDFTLIMAELPEVLARASVVVDNYRSDTRLEYPAATDLHDPNARVVVAIGGNTLSRGLTLEGLVVSYFVRSASAYDTLLQMGRWFGYRKGYEDLPRIWMTSQLRDWFTWIATVEYEIRLDIGRYEAEAMTPAEFAVRIRTHPKMAITSAAKMRKAVEAEVSYSGQRLQTILFNHRNKEWLDANLWAAQELVLGAVRGGAVPSALEGRTLLPDVDVGLILQFLDRYRFHENAYDLRRDPLKDYIAAQNRLDDLKRWNVVVMERQAGDLGTVEIGLTGEVGLMNRSRMDIMQQHANIKSLMSKVDRVADVGVSRTGLAGRSEDELQDMRPDGVALLLLYPIAKDSTPLRPIVGKQRRVGLDAVEHVIGVGMVFPEAKNGKLTPQSYMTADLSGVEREEEEVDLDEGEEPEDDGPEAGLGSGSEPRST